MRICNLKNKYGEVLNLVNTARYTISSITGLNPVKATINTTALTTSDGSVFNSSRRESRNIVLMIAIEPDAELNRLNLYRIVQPKQPITFNFWRLDRKVCIDGYVDTLEVDLFNQKQIAQISIVCPQPDFKSSDESILEFSSVGNTFEFEFESEENDLIFSEIILESSIEFEYNGEIETGAIFELTTHGRVIDPVIYNRLTGGAFTVKGEYRENDTIRIDTTTGAKSVKLLRDGEELNIINKIDLSNDWLTFSCGTNVFAYDANYGKEHIQLKIVYRDKYDGV